MSVYVDKFIRQHSEYFKRNKSFIKSNKWNVTDKNKQELDDLKNQLVQISKTLGGDELEERQEEITDKLTAIASSEQTTKSKLFKQEHELTTSIVGRLSSFIKTTERLGDRGLPKTQKFIDETVGIINIFIKKCDDYLAYKMDTLTEETSTDKEIELKSQEIKFQDVIFGAKIKIQDNLDNLNIEVTVDNLEVNFFKDEKASLILREPLTSPKHFDIKEKVESIPVNWNVRNSKEMFINMNPKDIPHWNHKKHFFDQDPVVLQFWSEELNKIIHGININGFFVHPWLYFHLNFFRTPIPQEDGTESPAKPDLRDNEWFFSENLKACISKDNPNYYSKAMLVYGTRRFGKALRNDQDLYYTDGSKRPIGQAKEGDKIFGSDGLPTNITGVYPQGKVNLYEIELSDGRKSVCCDEHLWTVYDKNNRKRVIATKDILDKMSKYNPFYIPITKAIEYKKKKLLIEPYILGYHLGDGDSYTGRFCSIHKEPIEEYSKVYNISDYGNNLHYRAKGLVGDLKKIGVYNNKHVPKNYLISSIEDRRRLLAGLLDSDGGVTVYNKSTRIIFTNKNSNIAYSCLNIAMSLGYRAKIRSYKNYSYNKKNKDKIRRGIVYRVEIFTKDTLFLIKEKNKKLYQEKVHIKNNRVKIKNIKRIEDDYATCIRVNNESREFLTNDFIVTHNSVMLASLAHWKLITKYYSNATVVGGSSSDLNALTSKVQTSMDNIEAPFRLDTIKQNWDGKNGGETTFGIKEDASTPIVYSSLIVQNLEEGQKKSKSQKTAGGAPSVSIYDEIGKYPFLKAYLAALPSFATPYGFKCVTVLAGCVCAGTKVWTNNGKLVNIEDLKQEDGIIGYDGKGAFKEKIEWFKAPDKKRCYRIETTGRGFIECSEDHPLLWSKSTYRTNNKKKVSFKLTKDLKVGEQLMVLNEVPVFGSNTIPNARLLGLLIGDGNYSKRATPTLSCGDNEIYKFVSEKYKCSITKKFKTKKGDDFRSLTIKNVKKYIEEAGIHGQTKLNKRLPSNLHTYDEKSITELLGGYFDADGNVYYNKKKNNVRVVLTSICEELLIEVKYLLLKLGIGSSISKEKRNTIPEIGYEGQQPYIYRLYINRKDDVIRFRDKIYFMIKHKQDVLDKIKTTALGKRNIKLNPCKFELDNINKKGQYFVGKDNLQKLRSERITKIEYIGEKDIYNMHTKTTNTYLSNGFVTKQTGGEADLSADAVGVLSNPELYDLLPMDWDLLENHLDPDEITWKRRGYATFFPGQMAYEKGFVKENKNFGDWIDNDAPEFDNIDIHVTNWKKNNDYLDSKLEKAKKDKTKNAKLVVQQRKVQYPRDPEDTFMSGDSNKFPTEEAQKKKKYLEDNQITGELVTLYKSKTGRVETLDASDKEIPDFPFQGGFSNAPVIIYERPHERVDESYLLYIAGLDDYNVEESSGDSLGSFCIYKRNLMDESSNKIVAMYTARPEPHKKFHEQGLLLLQMYNAKCYMENVDTKFKDYLDGFHLSDTWLVQGFDPGSEYTFNTSNRRKYGWQPTDSNVKFMMGRLLEYCYEVIEIEDEEGKIITQLGVERIDDIGILKEIIGYNKDGNFDRLTSFGSSLMYDLYLTSQYISPKLAKPQIEDSQKPAKKRNQGGLFGSSGGGFFSR